MNFNKWYSYNSNNWKQHCCNACQSQRPSFQVRFISEFCDCIEIKSPRQHLKGVWVNSKVEHPKKIPLWWKELRLCIAERLDWKQELRKYAMVYRSMDCALTGKNLQRGDRMRKKHELDLVWVTYRDAVLGHGHHLKWSWCPGCPPHVHVCLHDYTLHPAAAPLRQ